MRLAGSVGAVSVLGLSACATKPGADGRVVVVGGGFGGATTAKYLKWFDPSVEVTLIISEANYTTCLFSNAYLGGIVGFGDITHDYSAMKNLGVNVVQDWVTDVDAANKTVKTKGGKSIAYDRLVMSPGIDFLYDKTEGYDAKVAETIPHAWKAGTQTVLLRKQLEAMDDGGVVIISPPSGRFRCPPGPYERASLIAGYLKANKPRSKVLILDPKDKFSKFGLFKEGWEIHYKDIIEWVSNSNDGAVQRVDAANMTVHTDFTSHKGAVINFIPQQTAAEIAHKAGLTNDKGWCPIDFLTFESTLLKDIHVLGDSAIVTKMPLSGNAANTQAKVCAAAIVDLLAGRTPGVPKTTNTCYSLVTEDYGISVTAVYNLTDKGYFPVKGSGGLSPMGRDAEFRHQEALAAHSWYANLSDDIWG